MSLVEGIIFIVTGPGYACGLSLWNLKQDYHMHHKGWSVSICICIKQAIIDLETVTHLL